MRAKQGASGDPAAIFAATTTVSILDATREVRS